MESSLATLVCSYMTRRAGFASNRELGFAVDLTVSNSCFRAKMYKVFEIIGHDKCYELRLRHKYCCKWDPNCTAYVHVYLHVRITVSARNDSRNSTNVQMTNLLVLLSLGPCASLHFETLFPSRSARLV